MDDEIESWQILGPVHLVACAAGHRAMFLLPWLCHLTLPLLSPIHHDSSPIPTHHPPITRCPLYNSCTSGHVLHLLWLHDVCSNGLCLALCKFVEQLLPHLQDEPSPWLLPPVLLSSMSRSICLNIFMIHYIPFCNYPLHVSSPRLLDYRATCKCS